jgi:hypothetical protein
MNQILRASILLNQHPIAVSSVTGRNLPELFNAIITRLPFECQVALSKEINKGDRNNSNQV